MSDSQVGSVASFPCRLEPALVSRGDPYSSVSGLTLSTKCSVGHCPSSILVPPFKEWRVRVWGPWWSIPQIAFPQHSLGTSLINSSLEPIVDIQESPSGHVLPADGTVGLGVQGRPEPEY